MADAPRGGSARPEVKRLIGVLIATLIAAGFVLLVTHADKPCSQQEQPSKTCRMEGDTP